MWLGVMLGGALGALARYAMTLGIAKLLEGTALSSFPLATLLINVLGSFLLALIVYLNLAGTVPMFWRVALGVGFLGAFTTFSTFSFDLEGMISQKQNGPALLYGAGNVLLSLGATYLGKIAAAAWQGR
jgi:fluoride exporter